MIRVAVAVLLAAMAATTCETATTVVHREAGFEVMLPAGWRVVRLTDPPPPFELGFASPATVALAARQTQPASNPRYQDVLLGRLPRQPLAEAASRYCRDGSVPPGERRVEGAAAIACAGVRALGGDVQPLVETRQVFVESAREILWFSAEASAGATIDERSQHLEAVLSGLRLLPSPTDARR